MTAPPLAPDIDLTACLFGGQTFTWWGDGRGTLEGVVRGTHVRIDAATRTWSSTPARPATFLDDYLGAGRTRPDALADDADLGGLAAKLPGLRLLDQDPWEGLLSFMLSPVNNVPRIQENISRVARALGPRVGGTHAIPQPAVVAAAGPDRLRGLGLGFRAPRLWAVARAIDRGALDLEELAGMPVDEARQRLVALDGIGPKVAECVLCYALGFDDAFPVDRWVARASDVVLGRAIEPEEARDRWGSKAAMAQQLLFHGARMGLVEGVEPSPVASFSRWRALDA